MLLRVCTSMFLAFLLAACSSPAPDEGPVVWDTSLAPWPAWAWSHWVWEDDEGHPDRQQVTLDLVEDYLAYGIDVSAVIVDSPWASCYSSFEWHPTKFPDPAAMIDRLHELGVRVILWTVSAINTDCQPWYDEAAAQGYFLVTGPGGDPVVHDWWKGPGSFIDFFNPEAVAWWHGLLDKALDYGIDGWKADGNDYYVAFADHWSEAAGRAVERLEYSHAYYRDLHDHTRQQLGPDRIVSTRPVDTYGLGVGGDVFSYAPTDIAWAPWVGDQRGTFQGLRLALVNMYESAAMGYVGSGSDIGGFMNDPDEPLGRSRELFVRWAQLGAFSPVFENGGGGEHRPWVFGEDVLEIYRDLVNLRALLLPYMLESGGRAFRAGESVLEFGDRRLFQFRFGPDLFVAPVLNAEGEVEVRFPAGDDWLWLWNLDERHGGGSRLERHFALADFPAYVRAGSRLERWLRQQGWGG